MGKKALKRNAMYGAEERQRMYDYYHNMFYNLWMGKYTIEGMNYRQNDFFMRKLWSEGTVAIFRKKYMDDGEDAVGLAQWSATDYYDGLDMPTIAQFVQNRGDRSIPIDPQVIDRECVVGWAQRSHKPISAAMTLYASKLSSIDMLININEKVQKMPWLINVPEGSDTKVREFYNALDCDEPALFFDMDDLNPRALISGAPYILDKLYNYKQTYMNEALTFLGINNLGNTEKKENLLTAEVNHNNQLIQSNSDNFKRPIEELLERANKVLNFNFKLIDNTPAPVTNDFNAFGRAIQREDNLDDMQDDME